MKMNTNEELLNALIGLKKVLESLGVENIKNEVTLKDGTKETIDCYKTIEKFIVDCVNLNQPYKFGDLRGHTEYQAMKAEIIYYDGDFDIVKGLLRIEECINHTRVCLYYGDNEESGSGVLEIPKSAIKEIKITYFST